MLLKKIFAKYRCYDKLQLIEFDVIYAANDRQLLIELKSKRSYSNDVNAVLVAKKLIYCIETSRSQFYEELKTSSNVSQCRRTVLCSDIL